MSPSASMSVMHRLTRVKASSSAVLSKAVILTTILSFPRTTPTRLPSTDSVCLLLFVAYSLSPTTPATSSVSMWKTVVCNLMLRTMISPRQQLNVCLAIITDNPCLLASRVLHSSRFSVISTVMMLSFSWLTQVVQVSYYLPNSLRVRTY